ncbi:MAG: hypothetical protein OXT67_02930 [Zetaproteobacteria bacterium]|nr:hypothetical protein [Zetaproteobacteria bacterium]
MKKSKEMPKQTTHHPADRLRLRLKPAPGLLAKITQTLSYHHIGILKLDYGPSSNSEYLLEMEIHGLGTSSKKIAKDICKLPQVRSLYISTRGQKC